MTTLFDQLKAEGITYILITKKARTKFYAIKEDLTKTKLTDDTDIFVYKAEGDLEKQILKALPRDTWLRIAEEAA